MYISPYCRLVDLVPPNFMKFGIQGQLTDVMTCVKFLVDRFRGYGYGLECRLGVPVHCLQSNGVIIHMTSRTLHNAATSWITYYWTFPAGSRGGAMVGGLGDEVPQLKVATSKLYAFLGVIHAQYMKSKQWLLKTKTTKHNSSPQIMRQYELLSSSVWRNE